MPVVPIHQILDPAFAERYGVAAINVVDDLTLEAVLAAATEMEAPLIVQTSLKTVKSIGGFAAKYVLPAVGGWLTAKHFQ